VRALLLAMVAIVFVISCGGGGAPYIQGTPGVTSGTRPAPSSSGNDYGY
jgi:hypothetical protein